MSCDSCYSTEQEKARLERQVEELEGELKDKTRRISDLESTLADIEHKARYA